MTEGAPQQPATPDPAADQEPGPAGVQRIEQALGRLDDLPERPVAEHAAAFEELHAELVEALSTIDEV